jgi:hypothetical protein
MTMQETGRQERLGGDAPVRISARAATNGSEPAGSGRLSGLARSSELLVLIAGVAAVLIASAVDEGFGAERAWTLVTVLAAAYIVRRR